MPTDDAPEHPEPYQLHHADCLEVLATLPAESVHLILTDLPFEATKAHWDTGIDLEALWAQYKRFLTPDGVILLHADLRLATRLLAAVPKGLRFRYEYIWDKRTVSGFLDANRRPLRRHEFILVFNRDSAGHPKYRPQMGTGEPYTASRSGNTAVYSTHTRTSSRNDGSRFPTSILAVPNRRLSEQHNASKPVGLLERLILTHSDEGDTILDSCMGGGSTGVAALNLGRKFVGIEKDEAFFEIAEARIGKIKENLRGGDLWQLFRL